MGEREIEAFLSWLAIQRKVSASTQNQAFNAVLFLYRHVLHKELEESIQAVRAKRPQRLPTEYPRAETEWGWQFVFPARTMYREKETGRMWRHHLHPTQIQRALKRAVATAGIAKPAHCHTFQLPLEGSRVRLQRQHTPRQPRYAP